MFAVAIQRIYASFYTPKTSKPPLFLRRRQHEASTAKQLAREGDVLLSFCIEFPTLSMELGTGRTGLTVGF